MGSRFRGMTPPKEWEKTEVAKATRSTSCAHCGAKFKTAQQFYDHVDSEHPKKVKRDG